MSKQGTCGTNETCEECLEYDGMCHNQLSDHYQHVLGMNHPACKDMIREICCDE